MATSMPWFGFSLVVCVAVGAYAGLVVIEYAAWARANPNLGLKRTMAFVEAKKADEKNARWWDPVNDVRYPAFGAACIGFGFGILAVFIENISSPSPDYRRLIMWFADNQVENVREILGIVYLVGIFMLVGGFFIVASPLNAFKFADPILALRLVWSALVIFLSYPEPKNPLVHKLRMPWLRPVSVRLALTGLVLIAIATTLFQPSRPSSKDASGAAAAKAPPPPVMPNRGAADGDLARMFGAPQDDFFNHRFAPPPQNPQPVPRVEASPDDGASRFVAMTMAVVILPPVFVYLMIWVVGLTVLPTYFNYFEQPEPFEPEKADGDLAALNYAQKECAL
jgi:hypothetical protein